MTKLGAAILLLVAACGGRGGGPTLGNTGGGGGELTLAAALARDVGGGLAVAIVPGAEGLRAISSDGARQKLLVPGPVPWALVDNAADVVWYGNGDAGAIQVLDLDSPAAAPLTKTVVTGLPTETDAGTPLVTISYPIPGSDVPVGDDLTAGHPITPHVALTVSDPPSLSGAGGILEMWDQQEQFEDLVQQATITEPALIARLAARGKGKSVSAPRSTEEHRVELEDTSNCEDTEQCGTAEVITPNLWRVAISFSCGDGCYTEWQLYDPAAKKFLDGDWTKMIVDAWVAPDRSGFVTDGRVFRFDSGPLAATPAIEDGGVIGGGWLGGGMYVF